MKTGKNNRLLLVNNTRLCVCGQRSKWQCQHTPPRSQPSEWILNDTHCHHSRWLEPRPHTNTPLNFYCCWFYVKTSDNSNYPRFFVIFINVIIHFSTFAILTSLNLLPFVPTHQQFLNSYILMNFMCAKWQKFCK